MNAFTVGSVRLRVDDNFIILLPPLLMNKMKNLGIGTGIDTEVNIW